MGIDLSWLEPFWEELVALPVTLLVIWLTGRFGPSVKLVFGRANNSFHLLSDGAPKSEVAVYTEKYYVQNKGRQTASDVELVFVSKPDKVSIFEERDFQETSSPNGYFIITIPFIAPRELLIIDTIMLHGRDASLKNVNCRQAEAKAVDFVVQQKISNFTGLLLFLLMILGAASVLAILLRIVI